METLETEDLLGLVEVPIYECPTDISCYLKNLLLEGNNQLSPSEYNTRREYFDNKIKELIVERLNLEARLPEILKEMQEIRETIEIDKKNVSQVELFNLSLIKDDTWMGLTKNNKI